jgi:PAS domain S-box-containing protein
MSKEQSGERPDTDGPPLQRVRSLVPRQIRQNLTAKLLLLLILGATVSGLVAAVSYTVVDSQLSAQVDSQVASDTTVQATVYENWLSERWSSVDRIAKSSLIKEDSPSVLNQWLLAEQTRVSEEIEILIVAGAESGTILGSTDRSMHGTNLYANGLDSATTDRLLFISQEPVRIGNDAEPMTLLGTREKGRLLVAAIPANTTLAEPSAYNAGTSSLYSLSGNRLLGNAERSSLNASVHGNEGTVVTETDEFVVGARVIAHDVLNAEPVDRYDKQTTIRTIVVTATPKAQAFAFRQQILNTFFIAFSIAFALLVGSAVVSMRSVTREINRLSEKADQISNGVFDVNMSTSRLDELGRLYQALGEMRDSLQSRIEQERERKEAIEVAREDAERAKQELREVIDLVPDRIYARTKDGEYLLANDAAAAEYGVQPERLESSPITELPINRDEIADSRTENEEVIETGESLSVTESEISSADGDRRIYQKTKIPFDPPGRDDPAVLVYARDVTPLKEYEEQLETQRNNLEVLNKMVRHDIRNKLQLVLAYADMLESEVSEEGAEYLSQVLESAEQAVDITDSAREVAEVMLQTESELESISVKRVLTDEIEKMRARFDDVIIDTERAVPPVSITGDEMLASVFRNLLQNAVVHNDATVPMVEVTVRATDDTVTVRVGDNGPGIPDERKEAIFEEGDSGLESGGSGLGLYLVRTVVDQYGGDVWVEDRDEPILPGDGQADDAVGSGGAEFVVELPQAA